MRYRRTRQFKKCYKNLPQEVKEATRKSFKLFQQKPTPPYHPSLRIKPMKGFKGIFEGHVTLDYVFTFHKETDPKSGETIIVFRMIGKHEIYNNP
ncbi:MAG: hypothetical protein GVY17_06100 [Cyanobacteria bacterium]|jgi:mRNA-degrading endonuclease YafQ of YafQ-DinJ toxin-antitoxin module|nr:hypothetical protein [Cyanobacteria bacterium GSL.Bin21]